MKDEEKGMQNSKIILFPGTIERIVEKAHQHAEQQQFTQANELFEQVYEYIEQDEMHLSVYTYSLYEVKEFQRARAVAEQLLAIGPSLYFEAMELYLTICMQLREFKQVEKMIESLLEEGIIPKEQIEKFERLKSSNAEIADNKQMQDDLNFAQDHKEAFHVESFLAQPVEQQLLTVQSFMERNIRPLTAEVVSIIENPSTHPFIQSLLLVLLVEQQVATDVHVQKFGRKQEVNAATLELPTKLVQFQEISAYVFKQLEQEPSTLELVQYLIAKHAIVTYPFEWLDYDSEDVAQSYIRFVKSMFGDVQQVDDELHSFLQQLERISELQ